MNMLTDEQRQQVAKWIEEGVKLSEIQNRIGSEFGLRLTYMDVRFLVDDLKLTPKDQERPKTPTPPPAAAPSAPGGPKPVSPIAPESSGAPASKIGVSVSVDQLARPGAMVSGKVTFSDGQKADWYFDPAGRLGLSPVQAGYRPTPADLQEFQMALESELSRMGM
ncbi:MAG TPA: hypothetical protein VEH04_16270 [Verrucomicrobiae bacterium]|nr:hypothetical protein [Verrucomicrobiae bacterium]